MSRGAAVDRIGRIAWGAYGAAALLVTAAALLAWARALVLRGPVLYGEGAVAHAAILTRSFETYASTGGPPFAAANYPPLFYAAAAVGDPFVTGRLLSIVATLFIAWVIATRARPAGRAMGLVFAAGWLALVPVAIWGPALKPDQVALALAVGAVISVERRRVALAAVLLVLAIIAKPTAILVAIALLIWIARYDRPRLGRSLVASGLALGVAAIVLLPFGYADLGRHVVTWNALPWAADQAALVLFLGVLVLAAQVGGGLAARGFRGPVAAYGIAALAIAILGGREGATINYLLDLAAAASLALASVAPALARRPYYPAIALANLLVAVALLDPLGIVPGRVATTGAWGDPARIESARAALAGDETVLAEDSGLLVATGHQVAVDDLFLWSRLVARGVIDPQPLLDQVRSARFTAVVSEVELARLADAPGYERARWDPGLVQAVEVRYRLVTRAAGGLFIYRPR